jgi:branched-chain amino acid transport system substrate-binding protein
MLRAMICASALAMALVDGAGAQEPLKIGLIQSLTGPFSTVGRATVNGAQLYVLQHGHVVAGRRIELVVSDDASAPDRAKRIAQEMIVSDRVAIICAGITPSALAIAPLVTEARIPTVVMVSGASITVQRSPYMVRSGKEVTSG